MSYILHVDSNSKFEIEGKTPADVQAEIKAAGHMIGNVTLRRMMEGQLDSANGFELVESLSEEEQNETAVALDQARATELLTVQTEVSLEVAAAELPQVDTVDELEPVDPENLARAEAVRRRILGQEVSTALSDVANSKDDAVLANAQAVLDKKAKDLKPASSSDERKRRHTKREEMVEAARASQHGPIIAAVEAGVVPGVFLSYVNPDMRWFQFPVTELADPDNLHARTNTYLDLAPIVSGGWGFSLYVGGKSFTKRVKIKETDAESLVKAINEWLSGALAEVKTAA